MPYSQKQLSDAQNDIGIKNVCGCVTSSPQFIALVNEVQKRLARRGDWYGMVQQAAFVFQGSSVTWPRYVGTIIGARSCHHRGIRPKNMWYSFTGSFHDNHHSWHADMTLEDAGQVCTYNDITGGGQILQFNVDLPQDYGKTITLYGRDVNNQPLQQQIAGVWQAGLTLTAVAPYVQTAIKIMVIDAIVKQPMQGISRLFQYDAVTNPTAPLIDLAFFEPNETNPTYRRSHIMNFHNRWHQPNGNTTPKYNQLEVLVKLAFIPVQFPQDFLLVEELEVMKLGIMAVKQEEAGNDSQAEVLWLKAIRELNFEDREKQPDNYTPIRFNSTMARPLHNPF